MYSGDFKLNPARGQYLIGVFDLLRLEGIALAVVGVERQARERAQRDEDEHARNITQQRPVDRQTHQQHWYTRTLHSNALSTEKHINNTGIQEHYTATPCRQRNTSTTLVYKNITQQRPVDRETHQQHWYTRTLHSNALSTEKHINNTDIQEHYTATPCP